VEALVRREARARLHQALEGLVEALRRLWRGLADGKRMRQIAQEQGVSYERLKRQRRRLLARLAAQLRNAGGD
jgi:DNA-binding CsgD family transcriptional regulator